jgi:acetyltransferase
MGYPDGKRGEIAVAVGDPWQGKGVGATLMQQIITIARERGFETLSGIVLAENTHMLALAKRMGFQLSLIPGTDQYELKVDLKEISIGENHARTIHNLDS